MDGAVICYHRRPGRRSSREEGRYNHELRVEPQGLPQWLSMRNPPADAGDAHSIPGLGRTPGEGNGNPLQYSCPKNPLGRGAWRATVQRVTKSQTQLSD